MSKPAVRRDRERKREIPFASGKLFVGLQMKTDVTTIFPSKPTYHASVTHGATPYEAHEISLGSGVRTIVEYEQMSDTNNKLAGILVSRPMTRSSSGPFLLNSACNHSRIYCQDPSLKLHGKFAIPCVFNVVDSNPDGDPYLIRLTSSEYTGSYTVEPGHIALPPIRSDESYDPLCIWNGSKSNIPGISLARYNALRELFPKIDEGFSLPLFIKEFSDVRNLFLAFTKVLIFIFKIPSVAALIFRYLRREITWQTLSNNHLMVQFGVLPLIGDVQKIWKTLVNGQKRINNLCDRAGVTQCVHCQEVIHMDSSYASAVRSISGSIDTSSLLMPPMNIRKWQSNMDSERVRLNYEIPFIEEVVPETAKYHLTVWYKYEIPQFLLGLQGLLLALDQWGLNVSPSVFWQAIPFSFVVDWVYSVRKVLEQYDEKNVELIVSILSVMESVKYDWVRRVPKDQGARVYFRQCGPWPLNVVNDAMTCVLRTDTSDNSIARGTNYARWPLRGLPVGDQSEWGMPSGMQLLSGLSLLIQRLG